MSLFSRGSRVIVFSTVLLFSHQVFAHAHLTSQQPAANTQVAASPQALTLAFSEAIEPAFSGVVILNDQQETVATEKAQRDAAQPNQMTVPLLQPLSSGKYAVNWHVLSVDGHKTKGTYHFTVK